eukprot:ANDGO_00996.mRNA.1 Secretory carrier-associated membrane protein 4
MSTSVPKAGTSSPYQDDPFGSPPPPPDMSHSYGQEMQPVMHQHQEDQGLLQEPSAVPMTREEQLEARIRVLEERERSVAAKEQYLQEHEDHLTRKPNWPFKSGVCSFVYHAPELDVEDEGRRKVLMQGYYLWIFHAILFVFNMIACLVWWGSGGENGFVCFGLALAYLIFGLPLSHWLWYRQLYHYFRKEATNRLRFFYLSFLCQLFYDLVMIIGVPSSGGAGMVMMISGLPTVSQRTAGLFAAAGFTAWTLALAAGGVYMWRLWKNKGFGKASLEDRVMIAAVRSQV